MLSVKTIKKVLVAINIGDYELKNHFAPLVRKMIECFAQFGDVTTVPYQVENLNSVATAWAELNRADRYVIASIAKRTNQEMFAGIPPLARLDWEDFDGAQQAAIIKASEDALRISFTLFNSAAVIHNTKQAYIAGVNERAEKEKQEVQAFIQQQRVA